VTIPGLLARGRASHERLMTDTVLIERVTGRVFSPVTGKYIDTVQQVYAGKADVKPANTSARTTDAGQTGTAIHEYDIALPFAMLATVQVEDRVRITTSADPRLAARLLTVTAVGFGGRRTAVHVTAADQEQP
jgi:hypothetical protein